jgi:hypothetical protein
MASIGNEVGKGTVTEDEFLRVRQPILSFLDTYLRENRYWLGRVLSGSTQRPEQLDWARGIVDDYRTMTLDCVNQAAKAYLKPETGLQVRLVPTASATDTAAAEEITQP